MNIRRIKQLSIRILKTYFTAVGIVFSVIMLLSFTSLPFWMYFGLGAPENNINFAPDYIIVLGGGGIPSESGLMRIYKACKAAHEYPDAKLIIALPGDTTNHCSSVILMKKELISRGIDSCRIMLESIGLNTRMQALNISSLITTSSNILLITGPEHMYRAIKTFKKAGFNNIGSCATFEKAIEAALEFDDIELGGNLLIYNIGDNLHLRYQFWNHLKYQVIVYREYAAIAYYKLKGWI